MCIFVFYGSPESWIFISLFSVSFFSLSLPLAGKKTYPFLLGVLWKSDILYVSSCFLSVCMSFFSFSFYSSLSFFHFLALSLFLSFNLVSLFSFCSSFSFLLSAYFIYRFFSLNILSVPKITANLYCICLSIYLWYI